jgi:hypothetical protein
MSGETNNPAAGAPGRPTCGECLRGLNWVGRGPDYLNGDQWDAVKAGEYFIPATDCLREDCPGRRHDNGNRYWSEIEREPPTDWQARAQTAEAEVERLKAENEALRKLVYVPGVTKCAKCGLRLVSSILDATSGQIGANTSPQDCPNGCGPMWRVSERDAGNEVCDRLAESRDELSRLQAEIGRKDEALRPIKATLDLEEARSAKPMADDLIILGRSRGSHLTIGHLRRARQALGGDRG